MRTTLALLATAALPAALLTTPAAHADAVRNCVATARATFVPPLTTLRRQGTMTVTYNATCFVADTGGASGVAPTSGTHVHSYDGSCLTAQLVGPGGESSLLVGGSQMVTYSSTSTRTFARYWTFVSDTFNPCGMPGATVVQYGPDLYT